MPSFRLAACVAAAMAAAPASAGDIQPMRLLPGEAVTVRFDDGGPVAQVRGRAEWTRYDLFAAHQLSGMTPPKQAMPEGIPLGELNGVRPDPIPADEVRVRFLSIGDQHSLLVVENGQARALRYRARMKLEGQIKPTDVCIVLPRQPGYEHWPDRLESIELFDFEFVPWQEGSLPTCE
jgi:hypothetical protein